LPTQEDGVKRVLNEKLQMRYDVAENSFNHGLNIFSFSLRGEGTNTLGTS